VQQLLLPAHALAHRQRVQLVPHRSPKANQLVPVPQQLPRVPLRQGRNPNAREPLLQQQIKQVRGVAPVRLLFPHHARPNLARVADPEFMPEFGQQALEPLRMARRLYAHPRWLWQASVKRSGLSVFVLQPPLGQLPGGLVQHGDLLIARVKIASYNSHRSAPFLRALVV